MLLLPRSKTGSPCNCSPPSPAKADLAAELDRLVSRYHTLGQLDGALLVANHGKVV